MDQFMEGLNVFGLLDKIKQQPSVWEPLYTLVHCNLLKVQCKYNIQYWHAGYVYYANECYTDGLKTLFNAVFAEKGSNLRREQEQAYVHSVDFLDGCSGKQTLHV